MNRAERGTTCPACGIRVETPYRGPCPRCGRELALSGSTALVAPASRGVVIRDLLIFEIKLLLDGVGDLLLTQLAVLAAIVDVLVGGPRMGRLFYGLMRIGERFDLWLNLYGAARDARTTPDGLFGASLAGADTLLGKLEELVRERELPVKKPLDPRHRDEPERPPPDPDD